MQRSTPGSATGSGGMPPQRIFEKNSFPEIGSGGFWQLADYPTLAFKITAFAIANWKKYHSYMMYKTITVLKILWGGGGGESQWPSV